MSKPTVALLVVTYDQPEALRELLDVTAAYVDEIVVVHDGPDALHCLDIPKLFETPDRLVTTLATPRHHGYCEWGRKVGLALVESDWVFIVDDDERPSEALLLGLRGLLDSGVDYQVPVELYVEGNLILEYTHFRLARVTPFLHQSSLVHTQLEQLRGPLATLPKEMCLIHTQTPAGQEGRRERYSTCIRSLAYRYIDVPSILNHLIRGVPGNPELVEELEQLRSRER